MGNSYGSAGANNYSGSRVRLKAVLVSVSPYFNNFLSIHKTEIIVT